jgi:hypothetical protein
MAASETSTLVLYRQLLRQSRPYWPHVLGIVLLGLLSAPLALLTPFPLKIAFGSVLSSQPLPAFVGVLMPAGVAESASALFALTVGLRVAIPLFSQLQAPATSFLQADGGKAHFEFPSPAVPISSTDDCRGWTLPVRMQRPMLPSTPLQGLDRRSAMLVKP